MHTLDGPTLSLVESRMDIPRSLETLSSVIDSLEASDVELKRFRLRERDLVADGEVVADIEVGVALDEALGRDDVGIESIQSDAVDTLSVEIGPVSALLPESCRHHVIEVGDVRLDEGSTAVIDLAVSIPIDRSDGSLDGSQLESTTPSAPFEAYRDDSVPPFDDIPYLQAIYDACETFDEMRELIDLDVTTETVRRYMIDAGVHQPSSYKTREPEPPVTEDTDAEESTEDGADVEVLLADGIGIPDEIDIEEFIQTVRRSKTLHEVQQSMDLGREEAYDLLEDLNLLDLVVGRLAMESQRDVTRDEIVTRLRQSVA